MSIMNIMSANAVESDISKEYVISLIKDLFYITPAPFLLILFLTISIVIWYYKELILDKFSFSADSEADEKTPTKIISASTGQITCPHCGAKIDSDSKFCANCGNNI